jgi:hypothetical protein
MFQIEEGSAGRGRTQAPAGGPLPSRDGTAIRRRHGMAGFSATAGRQEPSGFSTFPRENAVREGWYGSCSIHFRPLLKHLFQGGMTMPAIMEQTTNNSVTLGIYSMTFPTLAYSKESKEITVSVIVSPPADVGGPLRFQVPPITIVGPRPQDPLPTWTVSWNFVLDGLVTQDTFTINMLSIPDCLKLELSGTNQHRFTFLTHDVNLISFSYDIATKNPGDPKPHIEDPTIVVTPDPIT